MPVSARNWSGRSWLGGDDRSLRIARRATSNVAAPLPPAGASRRDARPPSTRSSDCWSSGRRAGSGLRNLGRFAPRNSSRIAPPCARPRSRLRRRQQQEPHRSLGERPAPLGRHPRPRGKICERNDDGGADAGSNPNQAPVVHPARISLEIVGQRRPGRAQRATRAATGVAMTSVARRLQPVAVDQPEPRQRRRAAATAIPARSRSGRPRARRGTRAEHRPQRTAGWKRRGRQPRGRTESRSRRRARASSSIRPGSAAWRPGRRRERATE